MYNKRIKEIRVMNPNLNIPEGWDEVEPDDDGESIVKQYQAPMEGWDDDNHDVIHITQEDDIFKVLVSYAFGDYNVEIGESPSLDGAIKIAIREMGDMEYWEE